MIKSVRLTRLVLKRGIYIAQSIRPLIIDSSESNCTTMVEYLKAQGYTPEYERVQSKAELTQALQSGKWNVILCEQYLTAFDSLSALDVCKSLRPEIPFIILSSSFDERIALRALRSGCKDYVQKNELSRLGPAIERELDEAQSRIELQLMANELERKESELRQARKLEAVGQLVGGVAHDFNNMLAVILLHTERAIDMLDEVGPAELRSNNIKRYLEQIVSAGNRAANLTSQLLVFSRKQKVEFQEVSLNGVVEGMINMLERLLPENIELNVSLAADVLPVRADKVQLEQVIMNLVVNSRDALTEGGIISIETANKLLSANESERLKIAKGAYALLRVKDDGTGMKAETQKQIFEPFFTTKEIGQGTGLGLSTVHKIVDQHLGAIQVRSSFGEGTIFTTFWPQTTTAPKQEEAAPQFTEALHGTETIFVVEDDDQLRAIMSETLRSYGYDVLEASNGLDALKAMTSLAKPIHLLITDVVMPKMGGRQLATEAQRIHPHLITVYVSGHTEDILLKEGFDRAHINFLEKPFRAKVLLHRMRVLMADA